MSIRTMNRVWTESAQKGSRLLLLLAIADYADDDGFAWPGIHTLADKIRMSGRQTIRLTQALEKTGELLIGHRQGRANIYIITTGLQSIQLEHSLKRAKQFGVKRSDLDLTNLCSDKMSGGSDTTVSGGSDIAMSPEPSLTVNETSYPDSGESAERKGNDDRQRLEVKTTGARGKGNGAGKGKQTTKSVQSVPGKSKHSDRTPARQTNSGNGGSERLCWSNVPDNEPTYTDLDGDGWPVRAKLPLIKYLADRGRNLTDNQQNKLTQSVTWLNKDHPSPCHLFDTDPLFTEYVDARLAWCDGSNSDGKRYPNSTVVSSIKKYGTEYYGWLDFKDRMTEPEQPTTGEWVFTGDGGYVRGSPEDPDYKGV